MMTVNDTSSLDDLRASYSAIVDYHNNLVQTRFNVAGLFLAANAFLASGFFQRDQNTFPKYTLPTLGLVLTIICWLLELRTYQLLSNLGTRGLELEAELHIAEQHGFFALMRTQPIEPRLLILRHRLGKGRFIRFIVSHSFGIGALYLAVGIFWVIALVIAQ
ncbi:MAG: hypothetical protein ACOYYJ_21630 [Chloroflexota bacterium]